MSLKIAMVLDEEFPPDPRVENEAGALIEAGHSVSLFCLTYNNNPDYELFNGIHVYRYRVPGFIYSISALAYSFPIYRWYIQRKLKDFFAKIKFDAVHVHDMQVAHSVLNVLKKPGIHKILDLHENRPEIMKHYEHVNKFPGNILISPQRWKKWEHKLTLKYDHVVVVTSEAKDYLVSEYQIPEEKIVTFPNTVHPDFYNEYEIIEPIIERFKNRFVIFYLGDTGKRRGLETAIEALGLLKDSIPEIMLVVAGKSKYDNHLRMMTAQLNLNGYVSFEGYREMQEVPSYILASNVCISPLHRNIHHDTTYANKIFQYMSLGVPVLVSDCSAQKNVVEKAGAGLIHQAGNAADFAEKILELYHNPEESKTMGKNGADFIRNNFNQKLTSDGLVGLYNKLQY